MILQLKYRCRGAVLLDLVYFRNSLQGQNRVTAAAKTRETSSVRAREAEKYRRAIRSLANLSLFIVQSALETVEEHHNVWGAPVVSGEYCSTKGFDMWNIVKSIGNA